MLLGSKIIEKILDSGVEMGRHVFRVAGFQKLRSSSACRLMFTLYACNLSSNKVVDVVQAECKPLSIQTDPFIAIAADIKAQSAMEEWCWIAG